MHQSNVRERNQQVRQMRRIYQKARGVLIWLGPDTSDQMAKAATDSIQIISDFLCEKLHITIEGLSTRRNVYQEVLYRNRGTLPSPNECEFSNETTWQCLRWFYSHAYFTRLWVIQEVNATTNRLVHCGTEEIEWDRVDLVAGYIIMDTAFSNNYGFSETHCWWTATVTTERMRNPRNWLFMLYLASNFACLDERDMIYGLRGLMHLSEGTPQAGLLDPDYRKTTVEVYRDSVEAAFHDFQNTDVLLYLVGDESPSWIPRWERPMLFRNPFRFGKSLPWKPAGESYPQWRIDKQSNVLYLSGFVVDTVKSVAAYNEQIFSNAMLDDSSRTESLRQIWHRILETLHHAHHGSSDSSFLPLPQDLMGSTATALSYGLDADANPASSQTLLSNLIAYLRLILDADTFNAYISSSLAELAEHSDGHAFGKPVWDFAYPDSGFFVTSNGLVGCSVCIPKPRDLVVAMLGSTYLFILRPEGEGHLIRGYAFVSGVMEGERWSDEVETKEFEIY
jgi:Heterokaryon incompatibility protein (HET)